MIATFHKQAIVALTAFMELPRHGRSHTSYFWAHLTSFVMHAKVPLGLEAPLHFALNWSSAISGQHSQAKRQKSTVCVHSCSEVKVEVVRWSVDRTAIVISR